VRFQRKITHTLFGVFFIFLSLQVATALSFAGTVGLPVVSDQERGFTRIRFDYERLEPEISSDQSAFGGDSREERLLLSAGYSPARFLEFYLKFGLAGHETPSRKFNGSLGPAYGIGVKWTFYQKRSLTVGMGLSALEFITEDSASTTSRLRWDELEAFVGGVLGGFEQVSPYFGLLFSAGTGKFTNGPTVDLKGFADLFFGASFRVTDRIDFLSEVRLIRENGLSLSLSVQL